MDKPEACTNCLTRLHPLEVSELYRGKKLSCHVCGYRLKAVATGAWATVAAVLVSKAEEPALMGVRRRRENIKRQQHQ